jgi:hypothetical protein
MPRYRGTREASASLVGRLLLLIARGQETSSSLSEQLGVSPRTVAATWNNWCRRAGPSSGWASRRGANTTSS